MSPTTIADHVFYHRAHDIVIAFIGGTCVIIAAWIANRRRK
jgi:hypothetical protein